MRDRRFVAAHRGGPLDPASHALLAHWAADCAERALHFFSEVSDDDRPRRAIEICRAWANGEVRAGVAMKASLQAHAAAREATEKTAVAAARAAGQAVATAHCADHCMGALLYALKALKLSGSLHEGELEAQLKKLPPHLLPPVGDGVHARMEKLRIFANERGHSAARARPRVS